MDWWENDVSPEGNVEQLADGGWMGSRQQVYIWPLYLTTFWKAYYEPGTVLSTCIISFIPDSSFMRTLLLFFFHRWGNWVSEKSTKLPKFGYLGGGNLKPGLIAKQSVRGKKKKKVFHYFKMHLLKALLFHLLNIFIIIVEESVVKNFLLHQEQGRRGFIMKKNHSWLFYNRKQFP